jgi:hypothetical protein
MMRSEIVTVKDLWEDSDGSSWMRLSFSKIETRESQEALEKKCPIQSSV